MPKGRGSNKRRGNRGVGGVPVRTGSRVRVGRRAAPDSEPERFEPCPRCGSTRRGFDGPSPDYSLEVGVCLGCTMGLF